MSQNEDEFAHLAEEAAEVGSEGALPPVRRVDTPTASGTVSALVWGEGPGAVFLHGAGLNAHTWDATILRLGIGALAADLPGHGRSQWRDDFDYSPAANARAVAAQIDQIAPARPLPIVGQSLGGATAIALAAARPDLVSALVLVDVSPGLRAGDGEQVTNFLAGELVFDSREQIVDYAIASGIGSDRRQIARGVALNTRIREDGKIVFTHHLASPPPGASFDLDFSPLWRILEEAGFPVLLVHGTRGFLAPELIAEFRERVPRAILVELPTGHNVQEQAPADLADAIRAFLA